MFVGAVVAVGSVVPVCAAGRADGPRRPGPPCLGPLGPDLLGPGVLGLGCSGSGYSRPSAKAASRSTSL